MNQEIKAKWLEALRSGRYQQTQMNLKDEKGMCCLGVLCDVMYPGNWSPARFDSTAYAFKDEDDICLPPDWLCDEAGLPHARRKDDDYISDPTITRKLANFNDEGQSFMQIADYIEENL